jgi:DNA repair exonuclease SbcCD ATPase subunit
MSYRTEKKEAMGIHSQKELERPTAPPPSFKTETRLPSTQGDCRSSESELSLLELEDLNQRLARHLSIERTKIETMTVEMTAMATELHVQETMVEELKGEKERLMEEVHYIRKSYAHVEKERTRLVGEVGKLRTEMGALSATLYTDEDKISALEHANVRLIDELNFLNEMNADHKQ